MLSREFRQFIALNHLEASISTENFVKGISDSLLAKLIFTLEESLFLSRVENNNAWYFSLFKIEYR